MKKSIVSIILILFLFPAWTAAQTPEEKGIAVARESEDRDSGWDNHIANVRMVLRNRHNQERERLFRFRTHEVVNSGRKVDGDKILIIFDTPLDVKGTALLTFSHKQGDDDQWLYLPAVKRVKRISARNKSGSFVGSEFSYEDIASEELEKYTYKWIRDEDYSGKSCFVVERYPMNKWNSGYARQVVWYDKAEYRIQKIDFYDRKNNLLKTLTYHGYQQYIGRFWRQHEMKMINHQNGKSTELEWTDFKFHVGLKNSDFSRHSLRRIQ
jgi:outer membrane lipoprotein-sorting protein